GAGRGRGFSPCFARPPPPFRVPSGTRRIAAYLRHATVFDIDWHFEQKDAKIAKAGLAVARSFLCDLGYLLFKKSP
ncbi:MAG: hypothetical protein WC708_14570, partial [Lentisphaeria bacterium]